MARDVKRSLNLKIQTDLLSPMGIGYLTEIIFTTTYIVETFKFSTLLFRSRDYPLLNLVQHSIFNNKFVIQHPFEMS